ncbi:MAG TPA: heme-binding protein [Thermomicrobiales bacterium]|nr:heme-binding protein [Thermomicrobiales bacterium]
MRRFFALFLTLGLAIVVIVAARPAALLAAPAAPPAPLATQDLSLAQAQTVLAAALAAAEEQGTLMDVAVVDAGGNLKAFARMDGAWLGSIDIATTKARTARSFDLPTEELGKLSQPGGPLYGIEVSNGGLITFPGGLPLHATDGTVIGAIGVSGSTVENDRAVAAAGVAALEKPAAASAAAPPASFDQRSVAGGASGGVLRK